MTRRAALLGMLQAPIAIQQMTPSVFLSIHFPTPAGAKALELRWSDGTVTSFTEAELKEALNDDAPGA